jgi:hypothetical protein
MWDKHQAELKTILAGFTLDFIVIPNTFPENARKINGAE